MNTPAETRELWSTPKFFAILLITDFVMMFALNGLLNEVLALGVPAGAIAAGSAVVLVVLLPRWRYFAERTKRRRA